MNCGVHTVCVASLKLVTCCMAAAVFVVCSFSPGPACVAYGARCFAVSLTVLHLVHSGLSFGMDD